MSPEQATGEGEPDARSDIYSLGAVAYFMLTGRPPFPGENAIKVMIAHASQQVTPPSVHRPDIPADLEAIVLRCLAKHPADRFQDTGFALRRPWPRAIVPAAGRARMRRSGGHAAVGQAPQLVRTNAALEPAVVG